MIKTYLASNRNIYIYIYQQHLSNFWFLLYNYISRFRMTLKKNFMVLQASSILLILGSIAGYSSTKEYQKWLADSASAYDNYFHKSYAAASLFLLAFLCTFISSVIYSHALSNTLASGLNIKKSSSKGNAIVDEP